MSAWVTDMASWDTSEWMLKLRASAERKRKNTRKWHLAHPEQVRAHLKRWRAENPKALKAINDKWRASNIDQARESVRVWRADHPEKASASSKRWRENNPDRKRETNGRWQKSHWPQVRKAITRWRLRTCYGITPEDYDKMVEDQNGSCAICGATPSVLHIDHDHDTGNVRALLCMRCNVGLGFLNEDPDTLRKAADYIEKHARKREVA